LVPVSKKDLPAYRRMSRKFGKLAREYGVLEYCEAYGDELSPKGWSVTFPKFLKLKRGETAVFAWVVYASKQQRNRILKQVMADPRMGKAPKRMPFDMKRMLTGGFKMFVEC
jgi:uncharacterized protein YbaA (DUF1428 family)